MSSPFEAELRLLEVGELSVVAQLVESSNLGFVLDLSHAGEYGWAVYKPLIGERPLHDFPPGLHHRERAAFLLSEFLGWHLVPPTVTRADAPFGVGSLQWFIEHDPAEHYFPLFETRPELHPQLLRLAVFDLLANNTDRKSGHVLADGGRVWEIDHGLCFSAEPKLRTVIWDFAGAGISEELQAAVAPLVEEVPAEIAALLLPAEVEALQSRASRILRLPFLPHAHSHRQFPWPLI